MAKPVWVEEELALAIHDRQLVEHGGTPGVRDAAVLQSALARPRSAYAGGRSGIVEIAAQDAAGIVQMHPFIAGNKRTGFVVSVLVLELNGFRFMATEEAAAQAVLQLATGRINATAYGAFLRAHSERS